MAAKTHRKSKLAISLFTMVLAISVEWSDALARPRAIWDNGGTGNLWSTGYNWYGSGGYPDNTPPDSNTHAFISMAGVSAPLIDSTVTALAYSVLVLGDYFMGTDSQLHITGGTLNATDSISIGDNGTLTITGGTINSGSYLLIAGGGISGSNAATVNLYSGTLDANDLINVGDNGIVTITGGVINCGGDLLITGERIFDSNAGRINLYGGTITVNGGFEISDLGLMDITKGTLLAISSESPPSYIEDLIANDLITAYGSTDDNDVIVGTVNIGGTDYTSVTAVTPPPLLVPAQYSTIQAAIDDSNNGNIVIVADGNHTGPGNYNVDFKGKTITVRSENGPDNCIIDCQNAGRGFHFHNGEGPGSILDGFTITNGYAQSAGGGIFCEQSSPTITNCTIRANNVTAEPGDIPHGAGISCLDSSPIIVDCRVIGNTGIGNCFGGGISCYGSSPLIKNCLISENSAARGGAISCSRGGHSTVINSLMTGNYAQEYGGAIAAQLDCSLNIINCTMSGNSAGRGGAMDLLGITATITNSILWANSPSEITSTSPGRVLVTYSNVKGGWYGQGNIDAEPLFASPGDYHLVFGSSCIDAGTNNPPGGLPITDLDGISRPFDGDYDGNSVADMGTYEFHRGPGNPILALTPARFRFTCPLGGPDPNDRILYIWNAGGGLLNWQIAEDANWLQVQPLSGSSSGEIDEAVISVDANGLASDKYNCVLTVSDPCDSNNVRFVSVTFRVGPTLYVPADYNNIQAAIDAAFDGDEVIVADGVYTGEGNHDIDFQGKAITVRSENGPNDCVIDCQGTTQNSHRGFYFHSCENEDSILDGFTIINGYYSEGVLPEGGAIFCLNACTNPTIRNCVIRENTAHSGGGISCYGSSPKIMNCIIIDNYAYSDKGGGIFCWSHSNAKIIGCTICDNQARFQGGGVYFYAGSPVLTNSILWGNTADNNLQQIKTTYIPSCNLSVTYCNVQGGWSGAGNINTDPCFIDSSAGDYHLLPILPCLDAGDPNYSPAPHEFDIDGEPRVMGGRVDIGADEVSDMLADFDDDGIIYTQDLSLLSQKWLSTSGDQTWDDVYDLNLDSAVDFTDFASFAKGWDRELDTEEPTIPSNLAVTDVTITTVSLDWQSSMDNMRVVGYKVYRDGSYIGWTPSTNFTDNELDPGTVYTYAVSAYDLNYNESSLSTPCQTTTK